MKYIIHDIRRGSGEAKRLDRSHLLNGFDIIDNFQCQVILLDTNGNEFVGSARQMKGKRTTIAFHDQKHPGKELRHVKVVGRQDPTNSEKAQNEFLLLVMQGGRTLRGSPFIRMVWFPQWKLLDVDPIIVASQDADLIVNRIQLNESQRAAVHAMVGASPLIVVHGEKSFVSDIVQGLIIKF